MRREIILFGSGNYGHAMLEFLGAEKVAFFAHNGEKEILEVGGSKFTVLPFDEYLTHCQECYTIICASETIEDEIWPQLFENHIEQFLLWEDITGIWNPDAEQRASKIRSQIGVPSYLDQVKEKIKNLAEKRTPLIQDPHSEVEFYMIDSFELPHFLPIYNELQRYGVKARIVAEPQVINSAVSWFDYGRTIELLKEMGVEYCTLRNPYAKVAITTQFPSTLKYYHGLKFQVPYGTLWHKKKSFVYRADVLSGFDHVFVHGKFTKDLMYSINEFIPVTDISYPRYLPYFTSKYNRMQILQKYHIETDKPILVYYPTWDEYSSIPGFFTAISALRKKYYLISKPHHCTARLESKKGDLNALYSCCDLVLDGTCDLAETVVIANGAICDAPSGVVTEIPFLNPDLPMVLLLVNTTEEDFYVDIKTFAICVKKEAELSNAVAQILKKDFCLQHRKQVIHNLYSPDVNAGIQKAVEVIYHSL